MEQYVTLGDYQNLSISVEPVVISDEERAEAVKNYYLSGLAYINGVKIEDGITDQPVAEGDIVNIDYVGKKDDVPFEGGTAQGYYLTIGSGRFVEGFEEGLIGVHPGDTVDLNLTFPQDYRNTELAGAEVVFTVTVNYILPKGYPDSVIQAFGLPDVTTGEEFEQYVSDQLEQEGANQYEYEVSTGVLEAFLDSCTFSGLPQELIERYKDSVFETLTTQGYTQETDRDQALEDYFAEGYVSFVGDLEATVKQDVALQAVANQENLNISDEELDQLLQQYADMAGYDSVEAYTEGSSKEDYREYFMMDKVLKYLTEHTQITEG